MQTCSVRVRLGGDMLNEVDLQKVTPAQVVILKALHGIDAVSCIGEVDEPDRRPHAAEAARLKHLYRAKIAMPGEAPRNVFGECFPGAQPQLPTRFSDIGFDTSAHVTNPVDAPEDLAPEPEPEPEEEPVSDKPRRGRPPKNAGSGDTDPVE